MFEAVAAQRDEGDLWVFGYGSLVWRPAFPHAERRPGTIVGWSRRFWQGSTDHRGVPEAPGRVVTLVAAPDERCWGVAFRVAREAVDEVIDTLDHRERGGFDRREVVVEFCEARHAPEPALVYIANERNPNYLGPAPSDAIAAQIRRSHGPSGSNVEYALRLAAALREMNAVDDHVFEVAALLK